MEQSNFIFDNIIKTDTGKIKAALEYQIANQEYTKYLGVFENKNKSISIKAKNILIAKIMLASKSSYVEIKSKYEKEFFGFEVVRISDDYIRIKITNIGDALALTEPLSIVYMKELSELGGESFGCCHRYVECSDALKCVHPDFLTSLACSYKKNLDTGKIYYGKNKNL